MDRYTAKERSYLMSLVKNKDTKPESIVRSILHKNGLRFRLHRKDLPGCPDIILPKYKTAIFVNGCFWHGHNCSKGRRPASNQEFWNAKLDRNMERDQANYVLLQSLGWSVKIIWECNMLEATANIIETVKPI